MPDQVPHVLVIAGHDPSGSAGTLADARAISDLGGFMAAAVTAVTSQNTRQMRSVNPVEPEVLRSQIRAVLADLRIDAVKVGLVPTPELVEVVAECLADSGLAVVWDTVLASTSGVSLVQPGTSMALSMATQGATLITPNAHEAAILGILDGTSGAAALVTGGDLEGDQIVDRLIIGGRETQYRHQRVANGPFRGTGCALSSAIAVHLARGLNLPDAVAGAIDRVVVRLGRARRIGAGPMVL